MQQHFMVLSAMSCVLLKSIKIYFRWICRERNWRNLNIPHKIECDQFFVDFFTLNDTCHDSEHSNRTI